MNAYGAEGTAKRLPVLDGKEQAFGLPEGFKDTNEFLAHVRELYQEAVDNDRENRDAAMDDLRFLAGEQWDDDVKAKRKGRPCLTINRLPQFVGQVIGDTRINRPAIKVRPAEDADQSLADVRAGLIRSIEYASDAPQVYAQAGEDQVSCGIGNFRVQLEYATPDGWEQDIRLRSIPDPFAVQWDPMSTEPTGKDARHCFVTDEMPRKEFEAAYPDVGTAGGELGEVGRQGWVSRDVVRVTEFWFMQDRRRRLALLDDGATVDLDATSAEVIAGRGIVAQRMAAQRTACMYLVTGHAILHGPYELPISRVPIMRVMGREVRVGSKRVRFGLVRFAKDPQRLMNYWRSVGAELLALAPRAVWLAGKDSFGSQASLDDFTHSHTNGQTVLVADGDGALPQRVDPPPFPGAVIQEANLNAEDMKAVTGLYDASLGQRSNETSGKAIMARERQGDVATYMYHDHLHAAIREAGSVANELIPLAYNQARTVRLLGEDDSQQTQRINDPESPNSIDITRGRYDVIVETGPSYSTKRVEAAESMIAFMQSVPQAAAVTADLVAKAQDWPGADQFAERLKRTIPPEIRGPEEDGDNAATGAAPGTGQQQGQPQVDPAQAAQMQQQQMQMQAAQQAQQMQMASAQLDLQLKEAQLAKAQADAVKAEAQAAEAEYQTRALYAGGTIGQGAPRLPEQPAPAAPFPVG